MTHREVIQIRPINNNKRLIFMKKARIFFSAALVVSIVIDAFAFKISKGLGTLYCKSTKAGTCSFTADYVTGGEQSYYCGTTRNACKNQQQLVRDIAYVGE
jgi:hypothetical protein